MKRFLLLFIVALMAAFSFVACNENDEDEIRVFRTYKVSVKVEGSMTDADYICIDQALIDSKVDTSVMQVRTEDVHRLSQHMKSRLDGRVSIPVTIRFSDSRKDVLECEVQVEPKSSK